MTYLAPRHVEEVVVAITSAGKRIIGITSPNHDELVSSVASGTAEFLARSGQLVLLIDLQQPIDGGQGCAWTISDLLSGRNIISKEQCLDIITIKPDRGSRYAFADTTQLRTVLEGLLDAYQFIILELGPVLGLSPPKLNPLLLGSACDCLYLTCHRGSTKRAQLESVVEKMRAGRCTIAGIILNETEYRSVGAEIASVASWILFPMPRLRRRVRHWIMNTELLN